MCQIGLADPEKEVHVYLENVDPERGHVNELGPVIEAHAMPINYSAEDVAEAVVKECTHNGIEDMDVDGVKSGSNDENEVVETGVQDAETEVVETGVEIEPEVVGVEIEVNNGAYDDEVKEHDGDVEFSDHSKSDPNYVYVSAEDDGQSSDALDEINYSQSAPQIEQPSTNLEIVSTPNAKNASTQNIPTLSHETISIPPLISTAFKPPPLRPPTPI
ncbi:hypothetical protein JHK82_031949 [Glycine max]|nr:hypothetical protein JHK86_032046 [Glycine max]KAG5125212.1 hypothetical protein JHK82_031949 [Glycine max]